MGRLFGAAMVMACLAWAAPGLSAAARADTLVSIGDSFSSGESVAPYDADSDNKDGVKRSHKCHRSPEAWPRFLGVAREDHLACSGAKLDDMFSGQVDQPPDNIGQLYRLAALATRTKFDRVLLTVGGNDIGFKSIIQNCFLFGTRKCLNDLPSIERKLDGMRPVLTGTYKAAMKVSNAPLLVVGYPNILPAANVRTVHCSAWAGATDRRRATELIRYLDKTFAGAASDAGADFVSLADVLHGHELCTKDSWVRPLGHRPGDVSDQQQGHPLYEGQVAMARRVRSWLKAHQGTCTPSNNVAAIFDDSGSMEENDPDNIRRQALELLLSKPAAQNRTVGAVEFAGAAGPLFAPGVVAQNKAQMLSALGALQNDGIGDDDPGGTDYNAAFSEIKADQPQATSRIFLTDGAHNVDEYLDGHVGGPPTYVIGLNIGPAGLGDEDADRLARIASDTGGAYFPLRLDEDDSAEKQVGRLQGVINDIDARLTCVSAQVTTPTTLATPNQRSPQIGSVVKGQPAVEIVLSWGNPADDVDLGSLQIRDSSGRVIADLKGKKRVRKHRKKKRKKLTSSVVESPTFDIVTVPVPAHGTTMGVTVTAPILPEPTDVTVQVRPVASAGPPGQTQVTSPPGTPTSTPTPSPVPSATPTASPSPTPGPPVRVNAYDNYGAATAGHAMCRGNPGNSASMPGGSATQSFSVPGGVGRIDGAKVQIDPDGSVTAHAQLRINGATVATADAAAAGDTNFAFPSVAVSPGQQAELSISFTASSGKIITVYSAASVGGTLSLSNSCPAGAPSLSTGNGLRAVVTGWNR